MSESKQLRIQQNSRETSCEEIIYSEDYADYIVDYSGFVEDLRSIYNPACVQFVNRRAAVIYQPVIGNPMITLNQYGYGTLPKCYGLLDTSSMEQTGVLRLRRQPYVNLFGQGVIIGFVDTGIDYTHPAFIKADGTSRILNIWDQTDRTGPMPANLSYGTEYTKEQIDEALKAEDPYTIVRQRDELGHGTILAGIAAGNDMPEEDFTGTAPLSDIVVVKLKEAKETLKRYFCIDEQVTAYQENDILLGLRYLFEKATQYQKPIVICLGIGSNQGNHGGNLQLSRYLNNMANNRGVAIVSAAGNEGNRGHHYEYTLTNREAEHSLEMRVDERETGFTFELWAKVPNLFTLELISPLGAATGKIPLWIQNNSAIQFPLENTQVYVDYTVVETYSGDQVAVVRMNRPTPGIWRVVVYNESEDGSSFNIWLPMEQLLLGETFFINPEPDITICEPGNTDRILTITAYDHYNNSLYLNASRGYNILNIVKPELAAPGVNVFSPLTGGRFGTATGTSVAAAHVAGISAMLLEWGILNGNNRFIQTTDIENILIRGARKKDNIVYPNREWGYGEVDIYEAFQAMRLS